MGKFTCAIGISFISEEKPYIAMGQIGPKIDHIIDEELTAFQYSADSVKEIKDALYNFINEKIKAHLEILRVRESGDREEHITPPEFAGNIDANKDGIYNAKFLLQGEKDNT